MILFKTVNPAKAGVQRLQRRWIPAFAGMTALFIAGLLYAATDIPKGHLEKATFAAGCFWCIQPVFDQIPGVTKTMVGYSGGTVPRPTYEQVSSGSTGHAESIEVLYDPAKVSYEKLLDAFWHNIDPTTLNQQFPDSGTQYRTIIFYHTEAQHKAALLSKEQIDKSKRFPGPVVTAIEPAGAFWQAEDYHQKYYCKKPHAYSAYHDNSGRDDFFHRIWGKK